MPPPTDPTSGLSSAVISWIVAAVAGSVGWLFGWLIRRNAASLDRDIARTNARVTRLEETHVTEQTFKTAVERHETSLRAHRQEVRDDFKSVHQRLDKLFMSIQSRGRHESQDG